MQRRVQLGALVALVGLGAVMMPGTALAGSGSSKKLAAPTGIRLVSVTSTAFTVVSHAANARRYRLFASTNRRDLWVAHISHARASAPSASSRVSLAGLPFTTAPYYYRIEVMKGSHYRFAHTIDEVGLRPAAPTAVQAGRRASGAFLTWSSQPATGFTVTQSTSPTMTADRKVYRIHGAENQFTPPGLVAGRTYYYQVSALNAATPSSPSSETAVTATSRQQSAKVMTYNILEKTNDGHREGSGRVAPWSQREPVQVKLIKRASPDLIAVEEGAAWESHFRGSLQINALKHALGSGYGLAKTEVDPPHPLFLRTGDYILYKKSTYRKVGKGNHWSIGNGKFGVYQEFANRRTGARVLFVATHLAIGIGRTWDLRREAETKRLVADATRRAAASNLPIVYAGDFNSDGARDHPINGPAIVMRSAHVASAFDVAQSRRLASYNSANQYDRRPPRHGYDIDYIYTAPGVSVRSWKLVMRLRHGRLVGVIPSDHDPLVSDVDYPY